MYISIYTTGGTIDKVYFDAKSDYKIGSPQITEILENSNITFKYDIEEIFSKDSLDITEEDRALIVRTVAADTSSRILITHGTDTMVNTAKALRSIQDKAIVLVGSLSPARFKNSDALFNIGVAIGAIQVLDPGIYITMNGRVFDAVKVRKNRAENRFEPI